MTRGGERDRLRILCTDGERDRDLIGERDRLRDLIGERDRLRDLLGERERDRPAPPRGVSGVRLRDLRRSTTDDRLRDL